MRFLLFPLLDKEATTSRADFPTMSSIARDGILNDDAVHVSKKGNGQPHQDNDRTRSPSVVGDDYLKREDGGTDVRMADAKPTYKSWKKKYRKMRIKFDQLQAQNEELYQLEQKALKKTKQLAIYNEYDHLLFTCPQGQLDHPKH